MDKLDIENIFLDLDGTALTSQKNISPKTIQILHELKAKNINIFIATGRPLYMIKHELDQLDISKYVINVNGGLISDYKENKTFHSDNIDSNSAIKIINYLENKKLPYLVYTDKEIFYNCDDDNEWIIYQKQTISDKSPKDKWDVFKIDNDFSINDHIIIKILIPTFDFDFHEIELLDLWLKDNLPNYIVMVSQENIVDIIPANSSKGNGIKFLADSLNLDLNKTIAFGDANNDISMFQAVKYSVAMGNAVDNLKAIATHITNSNDEDGIYNFIVDKIL